MMLTDKIAVIYGAGGGIGGAVARAFAREGCTVFLTGRTLAPVEVVAKEVASGGGSAEAAEVDALDEQAVDGHLRSVIETAGRVDISVNAVGIPNSGILGVSLVDLAAERFPLPILPTRVVLPDRTPGCPGMIPNRSGVIMTVPALHARPARRWWGGYGPAQAAMRLTWTCPPARAARHPRGRPAVAGHAGDPHD
jgi:NAD(P)-dependent dehydrogenase (short-subunit alcohol dehydrogenase family)